MKSFATRLFTLFAFALLCAAAFPPSAMAKPIIKYHIEHVHMYNAGEVEVVGYFENTGDEAAYVKWTEVDITLICDNGQQMWSDAGIRHYVDDFYIPPQDYVDYTFYIQNPDIPEYHGKYRSRWHTNTHWERAAG